MKTLIQERNIHGVTCITINVIRVKHKIKVCLANEQSSLAMFSTDFGHIIGGDVGNDLGVIMCGERFA